MLAPWHLTMAAVATEVTAAAVLEVVPLESE
jgi:hypothetical protein